MGRLVVVWMYMSTCFPNWEEVQGPRPWAIIVMFVGTPRSTLPLRIYVLTLLSVVQKHANSFVSTEYRIRLPTRREAAQLFVFGVYVRGGHMLPLLAQFDWRNLVDANIILYCLQLPRTLTYPTRCNLGRACESLSQHSNISTNNNPVNSLGGHWEP